MEAELLADGKQKTKIYLDGNYAGWLYNRQIPGSRLSAESSITEEEWKQMVLELILPRGKKKALDLLLFQERTERELYDRLCGDGYTPEQTDEIMEYIRSFSYLDDARYAAHFFAAHRETKSERELRQLLLRKGVAESDIEEGYRRYREELSEEGIDTSEDPELSAIRRMIERKLGGRSNPEGGELQKLYAALVRKGFSYENIRKALSEYSGDFPMDQIP